ncbi:MAG: pyrimidine dimer DNA glycosylase/endonuclease V, partial [Bradymonadaceae bacterium]
MNIFIFDEDPQECARHHGDRHVVKMVLETAQILCTVQHVSGQAAPYKKTHAAHPCVRWVLESLANYRWLVELGLALAVEYTHRYGRRHKSHDVIEWCAAHEPALPQEPMTD